MDKQGKNFKLKNKLEIVKGYVREGLPEEEIAEKLGISFKTLQNYKRKFPELRRVLETKKEDVDRMVESSLLKRALGYNVMVSETVFDQDNRLKQSKQVIKHIPGDLSAQKFWLKMNMPEKWDEVKGISQEEDFETFVEEFRKLEKETLQEEEVSEEKEWEETE